MPTAIPGSTGAEPVFETEGVLGRRVLAWLVDALLVTLLVAALHGILAVLGLVTLGLGWALFALMPLVPFLYSWGFLASRDAATPGQRLMDLAVVEHSTGRRPTPLEAFLSTALFYFSFTFAPLFLIALVTPRHRTLHDLVSGLLVVRRGASLVRHGSWNMPAGRTA